MPNRRSLLATAALTLFPTFAFAQSSAPTSQSSPPNILFILADDLGYGDTGFAYQNARAKEFPDKPSFITPNLDRLASQGVFLTNHYTAAPVCAPARASLITGQSQGHCAIRDNQFDKPIPDQLTLPSMLKLAGYHTAIIGKWGLGGTGGPEGFPGHPMHRGFDEFFGFMRHATGHVYYHDAAHPLMEGFTNLAGQYKDVYDTDLFTARAKQLITTQVQTHPNQPFFLYLAYTAIHNALNVPGQPYPQGAGLSGGLQWPLTPTPATRNTWIHPDYANKPWTEPMKRYATMARRLDDAVGDLSQLLTDLHIADNTLIVFTSDNGPAVEGGADPRNFDSWAVFDGLKRDCWEGGVREPTLVVWPHHIQPNTTNNTPTIFYDWMPTLAQAAHLPAPAQSDGASLLPLLEGKSPSRLATLPPNDRSNDYLYIEYDYNAKSLAIQDVFKRKHVAGRGQQQAIRQGDYLAIRTEISSPTDPLRLYNVATDPHEDNNIAADPAQAARLAAMTNLAATARIVSPSAKRPYDNVPFPALALSTPPAGSPVSSIFAGTDYPYTPDFRTFPAPATTTPALSLPDTSATTPFALHFDGLLSVPADATYTFTLTTDGSAHLWLHDAHLIDQDPATPNPNPQTYTATVPLKAGLHPLRLTYLHHTNAPTQPTFSLHYSSPTLPDQPIPPTALHPRP